MQKKCHELESRIVELLCNPDPTAIQVAAPYLVFEEWTVDRFMVSLNELAETPGVCHFARAHALCAVTLLLLDVMPTWGLWDKPKRKAMLREAIMRVSKRGQRMKGDVWENPLNPCDAPDDEDPNVFTDIFLTTVGWKTVWPLCDFLREMEVYKLHTQK